MKVMHNSRVDGDRNRARSNVVAVGLCRQGQNKEDDKNLLHTLGLIVLPSRVVIWLQLRDGDLSINVHGRPNFQGN